MTLDYRVELNFRAGVPQTVLVGGMKPLGIAMHWTAGGTGRAGALGTVQFFIDRPDRNASYHVLVWWERPVFGVMWIVPSDRASHSMNPQPPDWSPNAEVRRILGAKWADPNAASLAVSFCGMPADLEAALNDLEFLQGYERLTRELLAIPSLSPRPLMNHGWGQPVTRYDAGDALIPAIYARLAGGDMAVLLKVVREKWTTRFSANGAAGYFTTDGPGQGERKWFTAAETVESYAETTDGKYRAIAYSGGTETLWMERGQLNNIPGTRMPPSPAYGLVNADCSIQEAKITDLTRKIEAARGPASATVEALR